jgi:hypothetical protein
VKPSPFAVLAALTLTLASFIATPAEAAEVQYVFTTVDSVDLRASADSTSGANRVDGSIVGIVEGQSAPQTVKFKYSANPSPCERMALMMIQKPGRYIFTMKGNLTGDFDGPYVSVPTCRLARQ